MLVDLLRLKRFDIYNRMFEPKAHALFPTGKFPPLRHMLTYGYLTSEKRLNV